MNNNEPFSSRLKHAWNAFFNRAPTEKLDYGSLGNVYFTRPDRPRLSRGNERSIVASVINRIAIDCSAINVIHCKLNDDGNFLEQVDSGLNYCFTDRANIDQTGRAFMQDAIISLLDEGCIAILPVDTTDDPNETGAYDIKTMRVAKVIDWYPRHVRVEAYDDRTGERKKVLVSKENVAIVENPLYAVMNEPNSTMQRLIRKLNLLDTIDEQSGSGRLDLIIQLPYIVKSAARKKQAEQRRNDIEQQLSGSKYGIAYTDGTERVTQLNRPVENNLLKQVEYLTNMFFSQLGITQAILDGTAKDEEKLNYYNSTVEPILSAVVDAMRTTFLTRTARSQRQSIGFFRDPFKLVSVAQIAEIADKMTRNEIMTSNEIRQAVGMKPSSDPKADELRNKNLSEPVGEKSDSTQGAEDFVKEKLMKEEIQNE